MRGDSNSQRSLQWFAFRMRNAPDFTGTVRILIANFTKVNSLYENGMQPSFFSRKRGRGWYQAGNNIRYEESMYSREINDMNGMGRCFM